MAKLFSVSFEEDKKDEEDGLLIDRLIKSDAGKDTADSSLASNALSEQKAAIKDKVEKAISDAEPEADESAETVEETPATDEPAADDAPEENAEEAPIEADPNSDAPAKVSKPEDEDEEGTVAADKPEDKNEEKDPKVDKTEESTESYFKPIKLKHVDLSKVCKPIKDMYAGYVSQLGNLKRRSVSLEDLPLVYTKESVIEALNRLCVIIDDSIKVSADTVTANKAGLLHLNEKFMAIQRDKKDTKKTVSDKDLLVSLAVDTTIDLNDSNELLLNAITSFIKVSGSAKDTKYEEFSKVFLSDSFKVDEKGNGTDLKYNYTLPGFINVVVSLQPYNGFSSNDLDKIGVYALNNTTPSVVDALEPLQTPNAEEVDSIINTILKIIEEAAKLLDNLMNVSIALNNLLKEVKANIDELKGNSNKKLDIPKIDGFFKDLIKNRAMITYGKIIDQVTITYLTGLLSFFTTSA